MEIAMDFLKIRKNSESGIRKQFQYVFADVEN